MPRPLPRFAAALVLSAGSAPAWVVATRWPPQRTTGSGQLGGEPASCLAGVRVVALALGPRVEFLDVERGHGRPLSRDVPKPSQVAFHPPGIRHRSRTFG